MCISKRETYTRKIQELGSLPPPAEIEKVSGQSISDLMRSLESINKKLKKYSHVNKKAFDQYVNFSEQREALLKRKDELDRGAEKVRELIESLDQQKDEAINRTFRGVRSHFKDVFNELVPHGAGELIMRSAIDDAEEEESSDESESGKKPKAVDKTNPDVSLYRGIGIKVRFSPVGENYIMSQLSGGQKALVALGLIFAIQRCDPAPFYLFDELDQALDSSYRSAVADLIQRQANSKDNPTQFIVSTFRPELVRASDRWFGISHQNKVSNLHALSKQDSMHFISDLMNEEEAVGEVATVATSRNSLLTTRKRTLKESEKEEESEKEVESEKEEESDDDDQTGDAEDAST
jgi:structural maintenance of chromosome 3 (chondroitin sulfate proteoglycan 6)